MIIFDFKHDGVRDFFKSYKYIMAKYKRAKTPFTLKFRPKKAPSLCLTVFKYFTGHSLAIEGIIVPNART